MLFILYETLAANTADSILNILFWLSVSPCLNPQYVSTDPNPGKCSPTLQICDICQIILHPQLRLEISITLSRHSSLSLSSSHNFTLPTQAFSHQCSHSSKYGPASRDQ